MSAEPTCVFCQRMPPSDVIAENAFAIAFGDRFPVSPGHTLIVPRRHEPDFLSLRAEEQVAVWQLIPFVRVHLDNKLSPAGYNVGINIGEAAGQTVAHAHLHVIPRFVGDVADPRGGIRWVIPAAARYWSDP